MTEREKAEKIIRERTILELLETLELISVDVLPVWERTKIKNAIKVAKHNLGLIEYTRK